jgi:hypothetical protein
MERVPVTVGVKVGAFERDAGEQAGRVREGDDVGAARRRRSTLKANADRNQVTPASAPTLNLWSRMAFKPFSVRMMKTISETLAPICKPRLPEPMA